MEYAVAALCVIDAFEHIEEGQLVAAYVETTASDYLIWVDLPHQRLVAAFADAKSYLAVSKYLCFRMAFHPFIKYKCRP